jgi:hypothetical protein
VRLRSRYLDQVPGRMDYSHIAFTLTDSERFARLEAVFNALREGKSGEFTDAANPHWRTFFDEVALKHFWWPTPEERLDWQLRWQSTPVDRRHTDPALKHAWDFASMIDAFYHGDYDLIALDRTSPNTGRLRFDPHGYPFGGTGCMHALIECSGGTITGEAGT